MLQGIADSGSNVKIQIKTANAGKKISGTQDWGGGLSLQPTEEDGGSADDIVAEFGSG